VLLSLLVAAAVCPGADHGAGSSTWRLRGWPGWTALLLAALLIVAAAFAPWAIAAALRISVE